jgi:hypothetical protein
MITEKKIMAICFTVKSFGVTQVFISLNMTNALFYFKKICSLSLVWFVSLEASLENASKKGFFRLNHWRLSRKAKYLIVFVTIAVILFSIYAVLPKQSVSSNNSAPGLIESAQTINSAVWMKVATNAWAYFTPGIGVNAKTGLPYAEGSSFTAFTDWDLGCYIQAVIDAQKLGLIGNDGAWDFSARINKVLTFLESRPLNATTNYPFQFYDATTGKEDLSVSQEETVDVVDTGRLFVALNNLINYNNSLKQTIDNIVLYGRSNYTALVHSVEGLASSTNIYAYLIAGGFASFWPDQLSGVPSAILNNIFSASVTYSPYGNVSLPAVSITGDPLYCSVFELNNNSSQLMALARQVYLASEAYYNATSEYAAFSEGNSISNGYIYEWVVLPNGDTWKITGVGSSTYLDMSPIIYNKVAFSFLALYNSTYARNMIVYLERHLPNPKNGYSDGADNSGNLVSGAGSDTNSLILDAAIYAIQNNR